MTFWVAVAKVKGSAEITLSNSAGEYGTVTLTVGTAVAPAPSNKEDSTCLTDNLEIRQEMVMSRIIRKKVCRLWLDEVSWQ